MIRLIAMASAGALLLAIPAFASSVDSRYSADVMVLSGDNLVTKGSVSPAKGEPVRLSVKGSRRYGGPEGETVESGFDLEMQHKPVGEDMLVEISVNRIDVTDERTGAVSRSSTNLQGKATRVQDGWSFETDGLPNGQVLKVSFTDVPGAK